MQRRVFLRLTGVLSGGLLCGCEATLESVGPRTGPDTTPSFDGSVPTDAALVDGSLDDPDTGTGTPDTGPEVDGGADAISDGGTDAPFDASMEPGDTGSVCPDPRTVTLHDTHAQALYFDGTYGPTTGVIRVADMVAGTTLELEFWHGHGGATHRFAVQPGDFEMLRRGERVTLVTTEVDGHSHMLFIDPVDARWRVSGATDQTVEIC